MVLDDITVLKGGRDIAIQWRAVFSQIFAAEKLFQHGFEENVGASSCTYGHLINVGVQIKPVEKIRGEKSHWVRKANGDYIDEEEAAERRSLKMARRRCVSRQYEEWGVLVNVSNSDECFAPSPRLSGGDRTLLISHLSSLASLACLRLS